MTDEPPLESDAKTPPSTTSRKILIALLIGVCALWGLDFQAKLRWQKALNSANKLMDVFENNPATYMEQVGKSPRINVEDNKLTQVYRWTGSLKSYDLLISFRSKDGSGGVDDVVGMGARVFETEDISKMQLAKKTGTLDENLVIPEQDTSIEEEPDPRMGGGSGGGGPDVGPGGGPGGGRDGGRGGRGAISAEQLDLEGDVKTKYESATEKMREQMRAMFTGGGGGSREEMSEKRAKLREQHETELKSILSGEQFKKYQELRSQQSQRGSRSRGPGNGNSPSEPGSGK